MGRSVIEHFLPVPRRAPLSAPPLTPNLRDNQTKDYRQCVSANGTGSSSSRRVRSPVCFCG